ncbi:uncharacterized protein V6R79_025566 [Siganus canaliculatus]
MISAESNEQVVLHPGLLESLEKDMSLKTHHNLNHRLMGSNNNNNQQQQQQRYGKREAGPGSHPHIPRLDNIRLDTKLQQHALHHEDHSENENGPS